jgi:hypothetical protein
MAWNSLAIEYAEHSISGAAGSSFPINDFYINICKRWGYGMGHKDFGNNSKTFALYFLKSD